jgi:hypothetical protein
MSWSDIERQLKRTLGFVSLSSDEPLSSKGGRRLASQESLFSPVSGQDIEHSVVALVAGDFE